MPEKRNDFNRFLVRPCVGLLFLLLLSPWSLSAAETSRDFHWRAENGDQIHGLYVVKVEERGMVSRVLAVLPSGPIKLTGLLDPVEGSMTTHFLDLESGWWAELKIVDDLQATDLDDYFQLAMQEYTPQSRRRIAVELTTSNGIQLALKVEYKAPQELYRELSRALERRARPVQLLRETPPGAIRSLLFLHRWLSPDSVAPRDQNFAHSLRPVVQVLAPLLEESLPSPAQVEDENLEPRSWELTTGPLTTSLLSPDRQTRAAQLELLSKFDSVENTDPLSDLRDHPLLRRAEPRPGEE